MPNEATKLTAELCGSLLRIAEEDETRNRDHLRWLDENPNEPDHEQQIAETETRLELARKAMAALASEPSDA
jgi:hypothetical protein